MKHNPVYKTGTLSSFMSSAARSLSKRVFVFAEQIDTNIRITPFLANGTGVVVDGGVSIYI